MSENRPSSSMTLVPCSRACRADQEVVRGMNTRPVSGVSLAVYWDWTRPTPGRQTLTTSFLYLSKTERSPAQPLTQSLAQPPTFRYLLLPVWCPTTRKLVLPDTAPVTRPPWRLM